MPEKTEEVVEKKEKLAKPAKSGKPAAKPAPAVEVAKEEVTRERHNSGDAPKEQRKGKRLNMKMSTDAKLMVKMTICRIGIISVCFYKLIEFIKTFKDNVGLPR